MNKRKSVSKVTEKDAKDATKYVLTHQTVDAEGDLETNLVKVTIVSCWNCVILNMFEAPCNQIEPTGCIPD